MKKFILLGIALLMFSSACTTVSPGWAGIKINKTGDDRGVEEIPISTGWVWYNVFTEEVFEYPTFEQTYVWTADSRSGSAANEQISFNSSDGMAITADISVSYSINPASVAAFYVRFRNDNINKFTHGFMRNTVRDAFIRAANDYTADQIYGPEKDAFVDKARSVAQTNLDEFGVQFSQLGFVGAPRLPQKVLDALDARVAAVQKAQMAENIVVQREAEAKQAVAIAQGELEVSKLRAEQNRVLARSITKELIDWRELELREKTIARWDGGLPGVDGGGSGFLLTIDPNKNK